MLLEIPHSHRSIMPPVSSALISTYTEALTQSLLHTLGAGSKQRWQKYLLYTSYMHFFFNLGTFVEWPASISCRPLGRNKFFRGGPSISEKFVPGQTNFEGGPN